MEIADTSMTSMLFISALVLTITVASARSIAHESTHTLQVTDARAATRTTFTQQKLGYEPEHFECFRDIKLCPPP